MVADVEKKCVLVTGGSRGIGLEIVRYLLTGTDVIPASRVVSLSRSIPTELETLAQEYPSDLVVVQGDVTDEEDTVKARDAALERWHRLDALILNAGVTDLVTCADLVRARVLTPDSGAFPACAEYQHGLARSDSPRLSLGASQAARLSGVCEQRSGCGQLCGLALVQVRDDD